MASTTRQDGNLTTRQDGNVQGDMLFVFLKISLRGFFISKSNNIFVYFLEDEVGLENRNSIGYKRKREAQATDVMTCDKDVERRARSREYQRNYHARLRAKAVSNKKEHPDPSMIIGKQPGLI